MPTPPALYHLAVNPGECQPSPAAAPSESELTRVPTYQYACTECGHRFEAVQSFHDDSLTHCPECDGRLRKVFNAVGVVFKGSGFYRTDSRSTSEKSAASASSGSSGSSESSSSGSDKSSGSSSGSDKSSSSSTKSEGASGSSGSASSSSASSSSSGASGS